MRRRRRGRRVRTRLFAVRPFKVVYEYKLIGGYRPKPNHRWCFKQYYSWADAFFDNRVRNR